MATQPGVILVGGAPLSGKTSLAQALAGRLGVTCISTDDISTAIQAITTADSQPALHDRDFDGRFRDVYAGHSPERLLEGALAFHRAAWPAIEAVARTYADCGQRAVIEGWGILPELVHGSGLENTKAIFLIPDETVYAARCRADSRFWEGTSDEEGLIRSFARRSTLFARMLEAAAKEHGLPLLRPDSGAGSREYGGLAAEILQVEDRSRESD